jgi:hypothetical protein
MFAAYTGALLFFLGNRITKYRIYRENFGNYKYLASVVAPTQLKALRIGI